MLKPKYLMKDYHHQQVSGKIKERSMLVLNVKEVCRANGVSNPWQLHESTGLAYESCRRLFGVGLNATPHRVDLKTLSRVGAALNVPAIDLLREIPDPPVKKKRKGDSNNAKKRHGHNLQKRKG